MCSSAQDHHQNLNVENRQEINYANLNDGLDEEDVYSPPRKKLGRKGPDSYPSQDRLRSHDLQTDRVRKKQKLTNNKEKELDLEKIMDESDTLPDIVQNRPVLNDDNVCLSDNNEPSFSRSSPVTSDAEPSNIDQLELAGPLTPGEFAEVAVSAAIENLSNIQPVNETAIPNNDKSVLVDETNDAKREQLVSVINESIPEATTTMEKNIETETLSLLPSTEGDNGDNGDVDTPPTTVLDQITENAVVSGGSLEQIGGLLGVTVPSNVVPPGPNLSLDIGDTITNKPMDVDINNKQNETLHGIMVTGNVVMKPLHGITDLNSLDHSYSRQINDSLTANYDYYATTEDEDNTIEGLLQLSATGNLGADFPGDNSQLLPIGARIPDAVPTDITLETAAVMAAIENIALEETVSKTTNTVSTQTTFTRQRHNRPAELSDSDTEDEVSKRPHTCSQAKSEENTRSTKKAEFKTVKYGIKKRRSSRTYACKECGKWKRDLKELNKHYKRNHKPVMCGICNQLFSLPSTLDKHICMCI